MAQNSSYRTLTCAEAVRSSLSCMETMSKASTVSFSQGSHNPAPPVAQTTVNIVND